MRTVFSEWVNEWATGGEVENKQTFDISGTVNIDTFIYFIIVKKKVQMARDKDITEGRKTVSSL